MTFKQYIILFTGVLALSTSGIFAKVADASSAVTAFYRLFIAALVLTPVMLASRNCREELKKISRRQWLQILTAGFFLSLHYLMWFESLNYTSVSSSVVLVALQPLFSLALDRFVSHRKVGATAMAGCIIALIGSAIIGAGDFQISGMALFGDILAFTSAGVISLYFFVGEKVRKDISAVTYSAIGYYVSSLILLIYILIRRDPLSGYTGQTWMSFLGLALIATVCGQFIFNLLLKDIPASAVTMSILGEPIGTIFLACIFLSESILPKQLAGMLIILTGMFIFFFKPSRKGKETE